MHQLKTMKQFVFFLIIGFCCLLVVLPEVCAHVPYLERTDFTFEKPFIVKKSIEQSIAVYAWLETDQMHTSTDIDVYTFTLEISPVRVYLEVLVPVCDGSYQNFTPWFALVGPGLPDPNQSLPFEIPEGFGVLVKENILSGDFRETLYEPFGRKWYYKGPIFDETLNISGNYSVYYWDPNGHGGDYVAVLGYKEQFPPLDILRSIINTALIRRNLELHVTD